MNASIRTFDDNPTGGGPGNVPRPSPSPQRPLKGR